MLDPREAKAVQESFGVGLPQVRRDHLVSHILAALSESLPDRIRFFGGTALSRTFLTRGRLSEDIDLIAQGPRREIAEAISGVLTRSLPRNFGRIEFTPALADTKKVQASELATANGITLRIQLLPGDHYPAWPFAIQDLEQRYSDAGPAALEVPTLPATVAWKTAAYLDRGTPRDLWDLASLAEIRTFTPEAAALWKRFGPFTALPGRSALRHIPSESEWMDALAPQTRVTFTTAEAHERVVSAWESVAEH